MKVVRSCVRGGLEKETGERQLQNPHPAWMREGKCNNRELSLKVSGNDGGCGTQYLHAQLSSWLPAHHEYEASSEMKFREKLYCFRL
jgi:hypothetical protein